jgi:F-type H+-transporting ATPase subunit delta
MKDKIIAKVYAASLYELGKEQDINVVEDLTKLTEVINASNDLENVLFLEVFTTEEKLDVFSDFSKKLNLSSLVSNTVKFLIQEKRLNVLPLIFMELIVIDDAAKGFLRGSIEGSEDSIDDAAVAKIKDFLKNKLGKEAILDYKKNEKISAGYRITVEDFQIDASLENQFEQLKNTILE